MIARTVPAGLPLALAALLAAPLVSAQESPCPLTYAQFALAVPHLDLDACPEALGGARTFCRAVPNGGELHVFAFAEQGEQCLLRMDTLDANAFDITLK